MNPCTDELKLVALDKDDIEVVSAHVQDALVKVADIFWLPREHRFVMALNRFDWMSAVDAKAGRQAGLPALPHGACASSASTPANAAISTKRNKDARLNLLAVEFAENDSPAGVVSLIFSGGGVIRLDVECLEAELADLGEVSAAALCPDHFTAGSATA